MPPTSAEAVDRGRVQYAANCASCHGPNGRGDGPQVKDLKNENGNLSEITGMVEKPKPEEAPSTLALIGRYVLMPEVFEHLDRHETGAGGEIQLTDAMAKMIGRSPFHALRYAGQRYDCGSRIGFLEANVAVALHRADTAADTRALLGRLLKA